MPNPWIKVEDELPKGVGWFRVFDAENNIQGIAAYNPMSQLWSPLTYTLGVETIKSVTHWKSI